MLAARGFFADNGIILTSTSTSSIWCSWHARSTCVDLPRGMSKLEDISIEESTVQGVEGESCMSQLEWCKGKPGVDIAGDNTLAQHCAC